MINVTSVTISFNPDINLLSEQISELSKQVDNVVVVDNDSNNRADIITLLENYNNTTLINLYENMGIAYAQNEGIKKARQLGSSHVVLFDHDSKINDGFVANLLESENELIISGERVAAVGPIFYSSDSGMIYPVPYIKDIPFLKGLFIGRKAVTSEHCCIESYFLIASGCLIRMAVLEDVGYMDSELFIDNVDLEWCLRAQSKGYKVFTSTKCSMSHAIGEGSRKIFGRKISIHSNIRKYYNTRNNLFILKYKGVHFGLKLRMIPSLLTRFFIGIVDSENKSEYLKYYYWAVFDFLMNKKGKYNH